MQEAMLLLALFYSTPEEPQEKKVFLKEEIQNTRQYKSENKFSGRTAEQVYRRKNKSWNKNLQSR